MANRAKLGIKGHLTATVTSLFLVIIMIVYLSLVPTGSESLLPEATSALYISGGQPPQSSNITSYQNNSNNKDDSNNDNYGDITRGSNDSASCNCVIFVLDNVQDYWLHYSQVSIMDTFLSNNQKLSVGLITGHIGTDQALVQKIHQGVGKGLFEPDVAGWHYLDYSQLTSDEQVISLIEGNKVLQSILGTKSQVFLPPMGIVDQNSLYAMYRANLTILAGANIGSLADIWNRGYLIAPLQGSTDHQRITLSDYLDTMRTTPIVYMPSVPIAHTLNQQYTVSTSSPFEANYTVSLIEKNIQAHGYAAITIYPEDVATLNPQTGKFEDKVDPIAISSLSHLISSLHSQGISLASFSDVASQIVNKPSLMPAEAGRSVLTIIEEMSLPRSLSSSFAAPYSSPMLYTDGLMTSPVRANNNGTSDYSVLGSPLAAPDPVDTSTLDKYRILLASIYNNYGKYLYQVGAENGVSPSLLAAILYVESHGLAFGPDGRMTIRFEACTFYDLWGQYHPQAFADAFQCNSPDDRYRPSVGNGSSTAFFVAYHGSPSEEWNAFELARSLDEDAAVRSISMGLGQIMGFNYDHIGYSSPMEMLTSMSSAAKPQLDGLLVALQYSNANGISCIQRLQSADLVGFADCYNHSGRDQSYAEQLLTALNDYKTLTKNRLYSDSISQS